MQTMSVPVENEFEISVRELVELVLRRGDLRSDRGGAGPARAWEGTQGHQQIQNSRPAHYLREVSISRRITSGSLTLLVRGRVDGLLPTGNQLLLEEIKTVTGGWDFQANPLHWAQAKLYAFIVAESRDLPEIDIQLTYLELETQEITPFRESHRMDSLEAFFHEVTGTYLQWLQEYQAWTRLRDTSIAGLKFPFDTYRFGQETIQDSVSENIARAGTHFLEAPTGIGKTIAILYAATQSLPDPPLSQLACLTAKSSNVHAVEDAFEQMRSAGLRLRTLTVSARQRVCFCEEPQCDPRQCDYARGYFDRNQAALREALKWDCLDRSRLQAVAQKHRVCPHALATDTAR